MSSAPYFINLEPPKDYDFEKLGPIKMPALKVHPNEENVYELPEIQGYNNLGSIEAKIRFSEETSDYIKSCNCVEFDLYERTLIIDLSSNYNEA